MVTSFQLSCSQGLQLSIVKLPLCFIFQNGCHLLQLKIEIMIINSQEHQSNLAQDEIIRQLEAQIQAAQAQFVEMQKQFEKQLSTLVQKRQCQETRKKQLMKEYEDLNVEAIAQKKIVKQLLDQLDGLDCPIKKNKNRIQRPTFGFQSLRSQKNHKHKLSKSISNTNKKITGQQINSYRNSYKLIQSLRPHDEKGQIFNQEYFNVQGTCRRSQRNSCTILILTEKHCKV